jgi:hypothetical protein
MTDPYATLPEHLAARIRATLAERETAGTNVHFVNERGEKDRFSFATKERADAFRARLVKEGLQVLS